MFPKATQKASGGLSIAFPDVCKVPAPIMGATPIPYPNIAKTAQAAQKKTQTADKKIATKKGGYTRSQGDAFGTMKGIVSPKNMGRLQVKQASNKIKVEATQLKGMLGQLNSKLMTMNSSDPNEWQKVVQDYVVAAAALYVTLTDED